MPALKKLLLLLVLAVPVLAQAPDPYQTSSLENGRAWQLMNRGQKAAWVNGYGEGLTIGSLLAGQTWDKYAATYSTRFPTNLTNVEIADAVDHFYGDAPENAPIPVPDAIWYVAQKAAGTPSSVLDEFAAERRRVAAKTK